MNTGQLQRRWSAERPQVYDRETRTVCLDIVQAAQRDENGDELQGYSYIPVEIDRQMDYGHVKSQLIEAGFAQKDEFGLLMNAVGGILEAAGSAGSWAKFKEVADTEDVKTFLGFCEFRKECAAAAREVMTHYEQ